MTAISPTEFFDELKGVSATDRWDVMVSYSEKKLNDLLTVRWKRSMKPMPLHFEVNTPIDNTSYLNQTFDIELGAPSLQFATARGKATLSFPLEGGWKSKIISEGEEDIPKKPMSIIPKSYAVDISVPVIHMFANETTKTAEGSALEDMIPLGAQKGPPRTIVGDGQEIHFEDDKLGSSYITFEFDNEKIDADIRNTTGKSLNQDSVLLKTKYNVVNGLVTYMLDKEHVQWIKYSIAVVTNKVDPGDKWSDLLRPSKCMFSTQPGVLNVFIKTKGSSSTTGITPPSFRHSTTRDVLPFPTGHEASIIISRHLFINDFLLPNLKAKCKELKSDSPVDSFKPASGSGLTLNLRLEHSKSFNHQIKSGGSLVSDILTVRDFTTDFDTNPLTVIIDKGSDGITPEAKWQWTFSTTIRWDRLFCTMDGCSTQIGRSRVDTRMPNTTRPFATISGDSVNISLAFRDPDDEPSVSFTPLDVPYKPGTMPSDEIPPEMRQLRVQLTPFEMNFPKLDFFATQNVFAPGTRFMTAKQIMFPDDLVLTGTMPDVEKPSGMMGDIPITVSAEDKRSLLAECVPYSSIRRLPTPPEDGHSKRGDLVRLLDRLYSDNRFLGISLAKAADTDGDAVLAWFREQGFAITQDDVKRLEELKLPGPSFDLRFAGGAYKLNAEGLGYRELFIQPVTRNVYIDGQETVSKTDGKDGKVLITTADGEQCLGLEFVAEKGVVNGFKGTTWPKNAPDKISPITGEIFFPWDSPKPEGCRRVTSPAEKNWELEANRYYAVGLDLASPLYAPAETDTTLSLADSLFIPMTLMRMAGGEGAPPAFPATVWKDVPGLVESVLTAPYRLFKFRQGIIKKKEKKILDKYTDKTKLFISDEKIPTEVLDEFHEELQRNINEALDVPSYRHEAPAKIREFIERGLHEALVRTLVALSRHKLADELQALQAARALPTKDVINEAIKTRLEADIDRDNYNPYLESCIQARQAELRYWDALGDLRKFREAIDKAKKDYDAYEGKIEEGKRKLEDLKKEIGERPPAPDDRKREHDLKSEIEKLVEKQKESKERKKDAEDKHREKEGERDRAEKDKGELERQVEFHRKRWFIEHEK